MTTSQNVLVVDSSAHFRRLIVTLLRSINIHNVAELRTISAIDRVEFFPHLIIMEWPADPTETILMVHRIRNGEFFDPRVPILALSPHLHHAVLELAWQNKIDDVIGKPVSAIELIKRSAALLDERWTWKPSADIMAAE